MKGIRMTKAEAEAHQRKHGFLTNEKELTRQLVYAAAQPQDRMNKTETRYSLILEAMKRRGDIVEWRFEGMSLSWGADPQTGKPMWYTPDFTVFEPDCGFESPKGIKVIEVKGPHIFEKDLIRFKGCRADWPMFQFEMHQRQKGGEWRRIQ